VRPFGGARRLGRCSVAAPDGTCTERDPCGEREQYTCGDGPPPPDLTTATLTAQLV
jgi:hypothetical protein